MVVLIYPSVVKTCQPRYRTAGGKSDSGDAFMLADILRTEIDSPIALAFLCRYPAPDSAGRLSEKRPAGFLASHAHCGRRTPTELPALIRTAPGTLASEPEAKG